VLPSRVFSEDFTDNLIALPSKLDGESMMTGESQVVTLVLKRESHWLSREFRSMFDGTTTMPTERHIAV
jgi:hypothetical protein